MAILFRRSGPLVRSPYPLVDPDELFLTLPGPPKLLRTGDDTSSAQDAHGYSTAGDLRVAAIACRLRNSQPIDDYDADLLIRLIVAHTEKRAIELFSAENHREPRGEGHRESLPGEPALEAAEFRVWAISDVAPLYVVAARYGNYIFRYAGRIAADGPFPTLEHFFEAMRVTDRHVRNVLQSAT